MDDVLLNEPPLFSSHEFSPGFWFAAATMPSDRAADPPPYPAFR
jgi:hypothetical protein